MERKCESCKFWRKFGLPKDGECHRNAPSPSMLSSSIKKDSSTKKDEPRWPGTLWPMTHFNQWCGEFQEKQDKRK